MAIKRTTPGSQLRHGGSPGSRGAVAQDRIEDGEQAMQRLIDEISVRVPNVAPASALAGAGAGNILAEAFGNKIR
ncbi:hypothetical protein GCM10007874_45170 [Labrys miyagiensis]|uniref:Uncharacterized protein n=1 Tax=Labrys miyagiensis TaxID=346912 RepID=A0ABQ6CN04_9HYPH|nr:hypothetical protein GCM10007874_45170 [Labrys miyagiensis]